MYTIMRHYTDNTTATERGDNISNILSACAIYLEDPDCINVKIWRNDSGDIIMNYWRE